MASVDLNFTKEDKVYVADIASPGKCIVQIERKNQGGLLYFQRLMIWIFPKLQNFQTVPIRRV